MGQWMEGIHRLEEPVSNTTSYGLTTSFFCDGAVDGRNPEIRGASVKHYIKWLAGGADCDGSVVLRLKLKT